MLTQVRSFLLQGIDAVPCEVEVDVDVETMRDAGEKIPVTIVGLPDAAVKESAERVRSALANSGWPGVRAPMLVNLAPADLRKEGPLYDLPIAVGLLSAIGRVRRPAVSSGGGAPVGLDHRDFLLAGELALNGNIRPIRGVIAMAMLAREKGFRGVIVPADNVREAAVVEGIEAIGVRTLNELVGLFNGEIEPEPYPPIDIDELIQRTTAPVDFVDVRGQEAVKRAIIVAAAGSHNLLMLGPPGTGKTMMARALPGVLPPLLPSEALDITRIYSAAGMIPEGDGLITMRPVRTPHHTASGAAVVGGGAIPKPGEISLAHHGILFLDELAEFPRPVLETLRQPLEDHVVTIARAHSAVRFPASFMLVAAMNPTPKGDLPNDEASKRVMDRYLAKLSGPLIDRVDIHVEAPAVPWKELSSAPRGTSSAQMCDQVRSARHIQNERQGQTTPNARLSGRQLDKLASMDEMAFATLGNAMKELQLSARAYDKIRRLSRTIADLDGEKTITTSHVAEAVQYRLLDRSN